MKQPIHLICLGLVLLCGCSTLPRHELQNARQALANAIAVGAEETAETEYLAAQAALRQAEQLVHAGQYQAARELLPYATAQARRASEQAVAAKQELAKQQALLAEERQRRLEEQEQVPRQPQREIAAPPAVKKPVRKLSSYTVTSEESLWIIAGKQEVYADAMLWPLLYKANRDQIKDPRKVFPGQTLTIPRPTTRKDLDDARKEAAESGIFTPAELSN